MGSASYGNITEFRLKYIQIHSSGAFVFGAVSNKGAYITFMLIKSFMVTDSIQILNSVCQSYSLLSYCFLYVGFSTISIVVDQVSKTLEFVALKLCYLP